MKKKAANRPKKFKEETKVIGTRVPVSKVKAFKEMVRRWLKKFEV